VPRRQAIQSRACAGTAWTHGLHRPHHSPVRVLAHIKKLDDCFGQFLVRVTCKCGAAREITPDARARLVGWQATLEELAQRMRCSQCVNCRRMAGADREQHHRDGPPSAR
jgi:hypothetical protein